ncbi:NDP-hexose 2,3-dehydratase family protein [Streptomyces violascens]|uniref:NDP-hexose 2,3-dehydratase n=1 Tax=Streptomyces violascens TaxID=67381 RepID=A0ABQ3QPB2_9ACTN|nr:NDP-hexose 2,3-dehydratase family protein [Streptomyces violascens]GGU16699.1 NDP-hexose 2,3-dehydratase [Streptomyces violascens]GHI39105.1 NDP-hexose 2,3-dehydratase [Streptomyces violascens]
MSSTLAELTELQPVVQPREPVSVADRIAASAASAGGLLTTGEFHHWFAERRKAGRFHIERIPFSKLRGWSFEPDTGNLVHSSGRFFSVEGLHVTTDDGPHKEWYQPIIKQPEVGILGILVKEFDGVLHFLMQAKMEPGNRNLLQLSPTVQATRSNYTKVHQGTDVKYIEYFTGSGRGRVLADVLQSEHGSWFYHKSNRNMIVEVDGDVPLDEDFCWLTLGQISELLHRDNLVNMDSRTVLACLPAYRAGAVRGDDFSQSLVRSRDPEAGALLTDVDLLSWFTSERSRYDVQADRIPLDDVPGWTRDEARIGKDDGRWFNVVAVEVQAGNREVTSWTQPLIEPCSRGIAAFLTRSFDGVLHVLANAKVEGGFLDTVELAPTVQCSPDNFEGLQVRPPFLDLVLQAAPDRIRYDAIHSEEGGRFLYAENRYLVIEADEQDAPIEPPTGYQWVTISQLTALIKHGHYVNVQARTLLACLNAMGHLTDD